MSYTVLNVLNCPAMSYTVLQCPILSYNVLHCPECPTLSYYVLHCPATSYTVLQFSCTAISCTFLQCPTLPNLAAVAVSYIYCCAVQLCTWYWATVVFFANHINSDFRLTLCFTTKKELLYAKGKAPQQSLSGITYINMWLKRFWWSFSSSRKGFRHIMRNEI